MSHKTVLQLTDLHILPIAGASMLGVDTRHYFERTLRHAHQQHGPFDLMLLTGDLAQEPCVASYQYIASQLRAYHTPYLCLPGNHDDASLMNDIFDAEVLHRQKLTMLGIWCVITLNSQKPNSPVGYLHEGELNFLKQKLLKHRNAPSLVAMHHPCIASGSAWLDTMQIENSESLIAIINMHPQVKAIACGHLHQMLEHSIAATTLYATPSTCFQFSPASDEFSLDTSSPGYRVFELHDDGHLTSHCHRIPETLSTLDRQSTCY